MDLWKTDKLRKDHCPPFQWTFRKLQSGRGCRPIFKLLHRIAQFVYRCEISENVKIGKGLYINHPYGITINSKAIIGDNCNIHKGVTIGQENRGKRKGVPTIGDCVWIGINSTIVGNITIGSDVLIASNVFVNCDIPSHSIVFGNPCIIRHKDNATEYYINNKVWRRG